MKPVCQQKMPSYSSHPQTARQRLLDAAYHLFSAKGISQVGVDTIVAEADCAKSSLYNNFKSKQGLALAFLQQREETWTHNWLEAEMLQHADTPEDRLLAVFDVFDKWFRTDSFEGCAFINVLLESNDSDQIRHAVVKHMANIRGILQDLAIEAGMAEPDVFAQIWHMLMKGSIIAAGEGNQQAAVQAQRAGQLILAGWAKTN